MGKKWIKTKASLLKQGDRIDLSFGNEVMVHSVVNYGKYHATGKVRRVTITLAGGDVWDVSDTVEFRTLYVKPEKVFHYSLDDVLLYCTFMMFGTSMVWAAATYKWWLLISH